MNEIEKAHLQRLADDDRLLEALELVLLTVMDDTKPNLSLNNEDLGAETRAKARAKELLEKGLEKIRQLKTNKLGREKNNPAI